MPKNRAVRPVMFAKVKNAVTERLGGNQAEEEQPQNAQPQAATAEPYPTTSAQAYPTTSARPMSHPAGAPPSPAGAPPSYAASETKHSYASASPDTSNDAAIARSLAGQPAGGYPSAPPASAPPPQGGYPPQGGGYPQGGYPPQGQPAGAYPPGGYNPQPAAGNPYPTQAQPQPTWVNHPSTAATGAPVQQQPARQERLGLGGKMAALFTGTVAAVAAAATSTGGSGSGTGGAAASTTGGNGGARRDQRPSPHASSTTPLNPGRLPIRATHKAETTQNKPIQTVLGVHNGVAFVIKDEARKLREHRPAGADDDCCYMSMGQAVNESFRQNLCCLCFFMAFVACRIATAFVVAPMLMLLNTLVAVILIFPTSYYAISETCKAKCLGPWTKAFTTIGAPILSILSIVTVLLWSLGNGFLIPFDYCMAESLQLGYLGATGMFTTGLAQRKAVFTHYSENPDLEYWDIRPWAPITALLGIVVGLAMCCIAYLFIALCLSPKLIISLIMDLWKEPLMGQANRTPRRNVDDPCYQMCMCCWESSQDLCAVCDIFFRMCMSFFIFLGVILFIPLACLIGLFEGGIAGADGWMDPKAIVMSPAAKVVEFYESILRWANLET